MQSFHQPINVSVRRIEMRRHAKRFATHPYINAMLFQNGWRDLTDSGRQVYS